MKKSELQQIIRKEVLKELFDTKEKIKLREGNLTGKVVDAKTDGPRTHSKKVKVIVLETIKMPSYIKGFQLYWVEYPKGYLDVMSFDESEPEEGYIVNHDVTVVEIISQVSKNPESYVKKKINQFGLKFKQIDDLE